MKRLLLILSYFQAASTTVRILTWLGMGLLPIAFICGLFWPRLGFGFAIWSCIALFGASVFSSPVTLRNLMSNRRLMMMPGFAGTAVLALLVLTVLASSFLPFFASLYDIQQFQN